MLVAGSLLLSVGSCGFVALCTYAAVKAGFARLQPVAHVNPWVNERAQTGASVEFQGRAQAGAKRPVPAIPLPLGHLVVWSTPSDPRRWDWGKCA